MYVYMYVPVFTYVCLQLAILKNLTMSQTKYQSSGLVEIELKTKTQADKGPNEIPHHHIRQLFELWSEEGLGFKTPEHR